MKVFFVLLLLVSGSYWYRMKRRSHVTSKPQEPKKTIRINFNKVSESIDKLVMLKTKLSSIENMITDIESCDPAERCTAVRVSSGTGYVAELLANSSSTELLRLLYSERDRLRSSIIQTAVEMLERNDGKRYGNDK